MKFLLLAFSIVFLSASNVPAQKKTCDLQLEVIQNQADSTGEKVKIEDAEAVLFVFKGMARKNSKAVDGMPYFENLEEGFYSATVGKKGYKSTVKRIHLDCSTAGDKSFLSQEVWMWSGSPKEKVHFIDSDYQAEAFQKLMIVDLAVKLPKPGYPRAATSVRAAGAVAVRVTIDDEGNVISAEAVSGHPLLSPSAVETAKKAKFAPSVTKGKKIDITGFIIYNFSPR